MVKINPELKATPGDKSKTKFWNHLNRVEFKNTEIMSAWFQFLANRDISGVVFNEEYRFDRGELEQCTITISGVHTYS